VETWNGITVGMDIEAAVMVTVSSEVMYSYINFYLLCIPRNKFT